MRWLITGGCGFIGTALVSKLASNENVTIRVFDNLTVGQAEDLATVVNFELVETVNADWSEKCELIVGDIVDRDAVNNAAKGADVIVHLAANTGVLPSITNPLDDLETNVIGTVNCLEACVHQQVPKFIFASSGAPVGEALPPIHERLHCSPKSPYGASKLAGEAYCSAYSHSFGLNAVALRFGNVYGPGCHHKTSVVAKFVKKAVSGETLEVSGDGSQTRDFIFIDDVVSAIEKAVSASEVRGEVFQIATGIETSIQDLVTKVIGIAKERDLGLIRIKNLEPNSAEVLRNFSDVTKALDKLGWQANCSIDRGIDQVFEYFLEKRREI